MDGNKNDNEMRFDILAHLPIKLPIQKQHPADMVEVVIRILVHILVPKKMVVSNRDQDLIPTEGTIAIQRVFAINVLNLKSMSVLLHIMLWYFSESVSEQTLNFEIEIVRVDLHHVAAS